MFVPAADDLMESWLTGVLTDPIAKTARFHFWKRSRYWVLEATGVENLLVEDMIEQNIAEEIRSFPGSIDTAQARDLLAQVKFRRRSDGAVAEPEWRAMMETCLLALVGERLHLLQMTSVYGASFILLASAYSWHELPEGSAMSIARQGTLDP